MSIYYINYYGGVKVLKEEIYTLTKELGNIELDKILKEIVESE